jgi:hypothetical protein
VRVVYLRCLIVDGRFSCLNCPRVGCAARWAVAKRAQRRGRQGTGSSSARGIRDILSRGRGGGRSHVRRPVSLPEYSDRHGLRRITLPEGGLGATRGRARQKATPDGTVCRLPRVSR